MRKNSFSQLGLFDSTSLGWGFDLGIGGSPGAGRYRETADNSAAAEPVAAPPAPPVAPHVPAVTYRLTGDRALAPGWKARAADTIAAIRLARQIEDEARPATAAEQARLALFTGFGATDLANSFFRRAGETFRPGWEALGQELEQLVSPEGSVSARHSRNGVTRTRPSPRAVRSGASADRTIVAAYRQQQDGRVLAGDADFRARRRS